MILRGLPILSIFLPLSYKGDNFPFTFLHTKLLLKMGPFLLEQTPFQKEDKNNFDGVVSPYSVAIPLISMAMFLKIHNKIF